MLAAIVDSLLLNYYFTPPIHLFTIAERENVLALVVFLAVAIAVSITVDGAARRSSEAARARAEAETLSTLAGSFDLDAAVHRTDHAFDDIHSDTAAGLIG